MGKPVVLSYGLGVDSSTILWRWLTRPQTRDFDLKDLIVITAMTGDEWDVTGRLVTTHILPLLRKHGVRFVQVARGGLLKGDGNVVLSDTRDPQVLHLAGKFRLSTELLLAGTVPQIAQGRRWCSMKFKGEVLDWWVRENIQGPFVHAIGFNADEERRVLKDQVYGGDVPGREAKYPLLEWNWGRIACEAYLRHVCGEEWVKSCCTFCPFTRGQDHILDRYRERPDMAAEALLLEHICLALNPNMKLYGTKSLYETLVKDGNAEALRLFAVRQEQASWCLYRVQRIQWAKTAFWRRVEVVRNGSRADLVAGLRVVPDDHGVFRRWVRKRREVIPATEELLAVAPVGVQQKSRPNFVGRWKELTGKRKATVV